MLSQRAFQPRKQNSHRADLMKRVEPYLKWLRTRPCFLSVHAPHKHKCQGKIRPCHFDPWGDKGMGTKVSDNACLPMCDEAHMIQTDIMGWPKFQAHFNFDGRDIVTHYWLMWRDGTKMGADWKAKQNG